MRSGNQPGCERCSSRMSGVFACLDEADAAKLSDCKTSHVYEAGQPLFYEGNPAGGVFCLRSGVVKLYKAGSRGRRHLLHLARAGDVLGLECFLNGGTHGYTAEMVEPGVVCLIDRDRLRAMVEDRAHLMREIAGLVARQLEASHEDRTELATAPVRERLALALLSLGGRFGEESNGDGVRIGVHLSRDELAELVGASTETVIRQLAAFRDEGIVATEGRTIGLRDVDRLARIAKLPPT